MIIVILFTDVSRFVLLIIAVNLHQKVFQTLRTIATIIVFIAVSFQCFVQIGIVSWYELNKEFVSKTLCENRDQPRLGCNGKCYLKKQLDKTGHDEKSNKPAENNSSIELQVFILPERVNMQHYNPPVRIQYQTSQEFYCLNGFSYPVFHPPQC